MLADKLRKHVRACFTGLWIESHEHEDALAEIGRLCREENWNLGVWDCDAGLRVSGQPAGTSDGGDPLAAIRSINNLAGLDTSGILVLVNFHRFIGSVEIMQAVARKVNDGKQNRTFVVVLSPVVQIPVELEKLFVVLEHELPDREQLREIAAGIATEPGEMPEVTELDRVLDASAGLTRYEAEGAYSLSLVESGRISTDTLWAHKESALKKSGLLTLHRGGEKFDSLGGLDSIKGFCTRAMAQQGNQDANLRPRGLLLLGPPGSGKSQFCKALGNETGRPTVTLDVGSLMGSLVGQSESRTRQALKIIDAMAPCVLFVDEAEKALAGSASSGQTDSGVSSRMFGSLLTWLSDHTSDVFTVCTCNDIRKLPPEFSRSGRFDRIYFLDLPGLEQKKAIWAIYQQMFRLPEQPLPRDAEWTGAEIRNCCRLAALLGTTLVESALNVVPVAATAGESIEALRTWATGRCNSADEPGIYRRGAKATQVPASRKVVRQTDLN